MAHRFHHAHIKSHDARASAAWWADMFGATVLPEEQFGSMLFCPIELDGVRINITNPDPSEPTGDAPLIPHHGLEHLGLLTDDLDRDIRRIESHGLRVYERRPGAGGYEIAFIEAPDGVCLELLEQR